MDYLKQRFDVQMDTHTNRSVRQDCYTKKVCSLECGIMWLELQMKKVCLDRVFPKDLYVIPYFFFLLLRRRSSVLTVICKKTKDKFGEQFSLSLVLIVGALF